MPRFATPVVIHIPCPACKECNHVILSNEELTDEAFAKATHRHVYECDPELLLIVFDVFPLDCEQCDVTLTMDLNVEGSIKTLAENQTAEVTDSRITTPHPTTKQ